MTARSPITTILERRGRPASRATGSHPHTLQSHARMHDHAALRSEVRHPYTGQCSLMAARRATATAGLAGPDVSDETSGHAADVTR